jgi:hypothetical protein
MDHGARIIEISIPSATYWLQGDQAGHVEQSDVARNVHVALHGCELGLYRRSF